VEQRRARNGPHAAHGGQVLWHGEWNEAAHIVPLACQIGRALRVASGQPRSPSSAPRAGPLSL